MKHGGWNRLIKIPKEWVRGKGNGITPFRDGVRRPNGLSLKVRLMAGFGGYPLPRIHIERWWSELERCLQLGYEGSFRVENKEGDFKKHGV
jgi:hypothetical protein